MNTAPINKIIPFSIVDGQGSRCAVFLQGCNLSCAYCHNPETQRLCSDCGTCVSRCPANALLFFQHRVVWRQDLCTNCDTCVAVCPNFSSPKIEWCTADEVYMQIQPNLAMLRGITVSGGECLLYPDFLLDLCRLAHRDRLTVYLDTNGSIDLTQYPSLINECDGFLLDVKSWDDRAHEALTGQSAQNTRKNVAVLADANKLEELRIVYVEGMVDAEAAIAGCAHILGGERARGQKLKLIRFRNNGVRGKLAALPSPDDTTMQKLLRCATDNGFTDARII